VSKEKKVYQKKYVISGGIIEQYVYEKNQFVGFEAKNKGGKNTGGLMVEENRGVTLGRARKTVVRAINSNPCLNKFLTLTFEENVTDLNYTNDEFKKWVDRVNYHVYKTKKRVMKYIAVIEFQKRGAVHYHVLCDMPYVDVGELAEIWSHGFIRLNRIKGNKKAYGSDECDNVGAYVCKYMTKDNTDKRLVGRKSFLMSRNLDKPIEVYVDINEKDLIAEVYGFVDAIQAQIEHRPAVTGAYTNDYTGTVIYNQYNLKRMKKQE